MRMDLVQSFRVTLIACLRSKLVETLRGLSSETSALEHAQQTPLRLLSESVASATDVAVQVSPKSSGITM